MPGIQKIVPSEMRLSQAGFREETPTDEILGNCVCEKYIYGSSAQCVCRWFLHHDAMEAALIKILDGCLSRSPPRDSYEETRPAATFKNDVRPGKSNI